MGRSTVQMKEAIMAKNDTAVATAKDTKSVAAFSAADELPAHLQQDAGLGNENVGADDLSIPRIDLIQQLSPQINPSNPKFIEGAKLGNLFNSLTGEVYDFCFIINLGYETAFQVFKQRKHGGGFEGSFATEAEAREHLLAQNLMVEQYDIVDTAIHKCLLLDENGRPDQPVLIYMSGSKQKVSKNWNSAIQLKDPRAARFASVWTLQSEQQTNRQGQPYQNYKVDFAGWASEELYAEAKKLHSQMNISTQEPTVN